MKYEEQNKKPYASIKYEEQINSIYVAGFFRYKPEQINKYKQSPFIYHTFH